MVEDTPRPPVTTPIPVPVPQSPSDASFRTIAERMPVPNHVITTAVPPYPANAGDMPATGRSASEWRKQYTAGTVSHSPKKIANMRLAASPVPFQSNVNDAPTTANSPTSTVGNHLPNINADADIIPSLSGQGRKSRLFPASPNQCDAPNAARSCRDMYALSCIQSSGLKNAARRSMRPASPATCQTAQAAARDRAAHHIHGCSRFLSRNHATKSANTGMKHIATLTRSGPRKSHLCTPRTGWENCAAAIETIHADISQGAVVRSRRQPASHAPANTASPTPFHASCRQKRPCDSGGYILDGQCQQNQHPIAARSTVADSNVPNIVLLLFMLFSFQFYAAENPRQTLCAPFLRATSSSSADRRSALPTSSPR